MKKFWHSGHLNISGETGDHEQPVGNINLAYVHEVRRPSVLEVISEGNSEDETDQTFSKESEGEIKDDSFRIARVDKELTGFKMSPQLKKCLSKKVSIQDGEDFVLEEGNCSPPEIDIWDRPSSKISRADLLPYLLEKMDDVDDACVDENCPYNRWLYAGKEQPDESDLETWEVSNLPDFSIPRPSLSGFDSASFSQTRDNFSSLEGSKVSRATNSVLESTKVSQVINLNGSARSKDPFLVLPRTNSTSISSQDSSCSFSTIPIGSNTSTYPIITLSKTARLPEKKNTPSALCCIPTLRQKPEEEYKSYSLKELSRPSSSCSCTHSSGSSCTSCSTCILEHEDPTAPHAFTVQGRDTYQNIGNLFLLTYNFIKYFLSSIFSNLIFVSPA